MRGLAAAQRRTTFSASDRLEAEYQGERIVAAKLTRQVSLAQAHVIIPIGPLIK